jgi:hypothetical protein
VIACDEEATRVYLDTSGDRLVEFGVCTAHFIRLENGARPVVVTESCHLARPGGAPALLLE